MPVEIDFVVKASFFDLVNTEPKSGKRPFSTLEACLNDYAGRIGFQVLEYKVWPAVQEVGIFTAVGMFLNYHGLKPVGLLSD